MPSEVQMLEVAPYLVVADVEESARYYRDKLGFEFDEIYGDPASFVILSRDGIAIMLRQGPVTQGTGSSERVDAYIWVTDVLALADELFNRGADVVGAPVDRPIYDGREMQVRDLDGNVICFGQLVD